MKAIKQAALLSALTASAFTLNQNVTVNNFFLARPELASLVESGVLAGISASADNPLEQYLAAASGLEEGVLEFLAATASTAGTKIRGYEGQMYYGAATGTEAIFANVVSFDLDIKADSIDGTDRSTIGWKDKLGGLKEWTGTVKANAIQSGADVLALYNALVNGTTMTGSFRPQDVTGGLAYTGSFVITSYKHASPENGLQTLDLTLEGRGALVLGTVTAGGTA